MRWLYMFLLKKSTGEPKFDMAFNIGNSNKPKYRKPLLKLLQSPDTETSYAAAYALGLMEEGKAFETLIQMAGKPKTWIPDKHFEKVTSALLSSVNLDDPAMLSTLFSALEKNSHRKHDAARSLSYKKTTPALLKQFAHLAVHDSDKDVRELAHKYLKKHDVLSLYEKELNKTDLDTKIIAQKAYRYELAKKDIEELAKRLSHKDPRMRKHAAEYLKKIDWVPLNKSEEARLLVAVQDWKKAQDFGPPAAAPLKEAIGSEIDYGLTGKERLWSQDLTMFKFYSKKEELEPMVKSVRKSAADALVKVGGKESVEAFISILDHPDNQIKTLALSSLGNIGDPAVVKPIALRLEKWNKTLTNTAVLALSKIGGKEAVHTLIKLLKHDSHYVRSSAIKGLGKLKDKEAAAPLHDILLGGWDEAEENIELAAKALGQIGSKDSVTALSKAISDERYPAFKESVSALASISGPQAKASLENTYETRKVRKGIKGGRSQFGEELLFLLDEYYRGWGDEAFDWIFDLYMNHKPRGLELTEQQKLFNKIKDMIISIGDPRALDPLLEKINASSVSISILRLTAEFLEKNAGKFETEKLKECLKIPKREDVKYRIDKEPEDYRPYGL